MDSFAYWIFGYKNFAEPIIRECIRLKTGWKDIRGNVVTPIIFDLLQSLKSRNDWDDNFASLKNNAQIQLQKRKKRMTLDAAFLCKEGTAIIGEFKSWGGWEKFSLDSLYGQLTKGELFPERLAIDRIYHREQPLDVSRFVIATNLTTQNNEDIVWQIGDLVVEVFDISDLLRDYGEHASKQCNGFEYLDQCVNEVKEYTKTGRSEDKSMVSNRISRVESARKLKSWESEYLRIFVDDDKGYLQWLKHNPLGFVINCERKPSPHYLILHCASCGTITKATRGPGNWTTTGFIKICSLRERELERWAEKEIRGELQPCQRCKP